MNDFGEFGDDFADDDGMMDDMMGDDDLIPEDEVPTQSGNLRARLERQM
jgi:hypothetical protein